MLHFIWTQYIFDKDSYQKYEFSNYEIVKYGRKYFEEVTDLHLDNFFCSRVTSSPEDILLGHPTWGSTTNNWVSDNALESGADSHPNTYIWMPWLPLFPEEFIMPYLEEQLLAARKIFTICGEIWIEKTNQLTDDSIQSRVRSKLVRGNMGCNAELLPYKKNFSKSPQRQLLHVSNMGSTKGIDLMFDSLVGLDTTLCIASAAVKDNVGKGATITLPNSKGEQTQYNFTSLGSISNSDPDINKAIIDNCDFYLHTSTYDAQATTILENCARGLVPLITPESGFSCPDAIYLTMNPEENREIIHQALNMSPDEYEARSKGVRNHILKHHSWDSVFKNIWDGIVADQAEQASLDSVKNESQSQEGVSVRASEQLVELAVLADSQYKEGLYKKAEKNYCQLLQRFPDNSTVLQSLAAVCQKTNRLEEALVYLRKIVVLHPTDAVAHCNLAKVLQQMDRKGEAIASFEKAIATDPDSLVALDNLGFLYKTMNKLIEARKLHEKVVKLDPAHASGWNNLGIINGLEGYPDLAQEQFNKALTLNPEFSEAHLNLGALLKDLGKLKQAVFHLEKCLETDADNAVALNNLANVYLSACQQSKAVHLYRKALAIQPDYIEAHSNLLLCLHYDSENSVKEIFEEHLRWSRVHLANIEVQNHPAGKSNENGILKVGYISADLREHSVSRFIEPVILGHKPEKVELFVYSDVRNPDQVTGRLQKTVGAGWRDITSLDDKQLCEQISNDQIDILVELGGHTAHNRLIAMAAKPAPIQISYLGYPDTTGLSSIDYRLTDGLVDPEGTIDSYYTEKLWRLPQGFFSYMPNRDAPAVELPPSLKNGYITFGSFNMSSKINQEVVRLWARILEAVPNSRFLLKAAVFTDGVTVDYLRQLFADHGIEAERLVFKGHQPDSVSHLKLYGEIDIALDPFPYNGTTTTLEALWMGRPVISLIGNSHAARVGYSILNQLGLESCLAETEEEYLTAAVALAADTKQLQELTMGMRQRMESSTLLDSKSFVTSLEGAYCQMWQKFCNSSPDMEVAVIKVERELAVVVPDSLTLMTPYILREQETWFEQELPFVKKVVEEGSQCLDIGANYGLYALTMANKCRPSGKVIAFEPTSSTAGCLAMSIRENNLDTIQLVESALSDHCGIGVMQVGENTELSSLLKTDTAGDGQQEVNLITLDSCILKYDFQDIEVVKLDAEGEEGNIIRGGKEFFSKFNPLVMYELTHGEGFNLDLMKQWRDIGYKSYYLIPGLQILAPFDQNKQPDKFQLNLFACKDDRAEVLNGRGLLSYGTQKEVVLDPVPDRRQSYFNSLPFGRAFQEMWSVGSPDEQGANTRYITALDCYVEAQDETKSAGERLALLKMSYLLLTELCQQWPILPHLLSLARVASDIGERFNAVTILDHLYEMFQSDQPLELNKEHLAVSKRYDHLEPHGNVGEWCLSSIIEQGEKLRTFSSYYAGVSSLPMLEILKDLGFQSHEMERRRQLLLIRDGQQEYPLGGEVFSRNSDENLNGQWWNENIHSV